MKAARPYNSLLIQLFIWTTAITLVSVLLVSSIAYINLNTQIQENADNYYQKRFTYACEIAEQRYCTRSRHAARISYFIFH